MPGMYIGYNTFKIRHMSCQGNENCPLDNQNDSNKRLNEKLDALEAKLNAMLGDQNNKKTGSNPVSPQINSPDSKQGDSKNESKSRRAWLYAITDIFNNLTKLVPTILNSDRGFPALFGYGGLVVGGTCAILIAFGSNKEGLKMIYRLGLLGIALAFIVFVVWVFWDPDRPGRRKRGLGSGKKKNKQQNSDNNIDNSESDDDMTNSLENLEQKIEHMTVLGAPGYGKSSSLYQVLAREQNKAQSFILVLWINDTGKNRSMDAYSEYLKLMTSLLVVSMHSPMTVVMHCQGNVFIDFLFSLSQKKHKVDNMINSKIVDMFNESARDENLRSFLILYRRGLYHPIVNELKLNLPEMRIEKERISLEDYRSSEFDKVFIEFFHHVIRKFAEEINLQRDIKMSKGRKIDINYAIDDSFQLYKEKKKIYPTITHNYLFQIPEIKRLSQNSSVTKESNILNHKFSFALQANTNQCSTEDEQIQISISNNQKTKSNKLLRKKIKLNLN